MTLEKNLHKIGKELIAAFFNLLERQPFVTKADQASLLGQTCSADELEDYARTRIQSLSCSWLI